MKSLTSFAIVAGWIAPAEPGRCRRTGGAGTGPERADCEGIGYDRWRIDHIFLLVPAQAFVANWLQSFKQFPPRQKPASFNLDRVMEDLTKGPRAN